MRDWFSTITQSPHESNFYLNVRMAKRFRYLTLYLALITLFAGPVLVQQATGLFFVRPLPFAIGYLLMAANALPLAVLLAFTPQPVASADRAYWLLPLMALQLWPLLSLAIHPTLPTAPVWRFLFLAYCVGLALLIVIVWLVIAAVPSLGFSSYAAV